MDLNYEDLVPNQVVKKKYTVGGGETQGGNSETTLYLSPYTL